MGRFRAFAMASAVCLVRMRSEEKIRSMFLPFSSSATCVACCLPSGVRADSCQPWMRLSVL